MSMYERPLLRWLCGTRFLELGRRTAVMGVLNVTPDSFSDGGRYVDLPAAMARARDMATEGAHVVDVGGESTRPGSAPVEAQEEAARVVPVIQALRAEWSGLISIDTRKAAVARAAIEAGADIVNDVSALTHDPNMAAVVRASGVGVVLMHMRGTPQTMQNEPVYAEVVRDVAAFLSGRVSWLEAQGVDRRRLAVDPGIGFGKTVEHNLDLLAGLPSLAALGLPVVVGVSRKSFLGALTGRAVGERLPASLAAGVVAALRGAQILRVHDVKETCDALAVADMLAVRTAPWIS